MKTLDLGYRPRPHQAALHARKSRFTVAAWHRRSGKTVMAVMELLHEALAGGKKRGRYYYVAPTQKQAKAVAWDILKFYASRVPGARFKETELSCDFRNGNRITLRGADNPDSLRGVALDGLVIDETALMPRRLWGEILYPALSDRDGWALFIGTPQGRNVFFELFERARKDPLWRASLCRASETGVLTQGQLETARAQMTPEEYAQEFECSFEAAVPGAYYGRDMAEAERGGRVCEAPPDPLLPVHTAWDLGVADATAVWFFQAAGSQVRLVDFHEASGFGLPHHVEVLRARGYCYGVHIAPSDVMVRDFSTGVTRFETARSLGVDFTVAPRLPFAEGIHAARMLLPRAVFDAGRCEAGIEA